MRLKLRFADVFSILNLVSGFFGVCLQNVKFVMLSVLMDGLDGVFARRFGGSELGKELDSLADSVSFGVLPSYILFKSGYVYASILYLVSSVYRLARFNVLNRENFIGLPTTASALLLTCLISLNFPRVDLVAIALSLLMVSGLEYRKIKSICITIPAGILIALAIFFDQLMYVVLVLTSIYVISPLLKLKL